MKVSAGTYLHALDFFENFIPQSIKQVSFPRPGPPPAEDYKLGPGSSLEPAKAADSGPNISITLMKLSKCKYS